MNDHALAARPCPQCGHVEGPDDHLPPPALYRPWHVRGRRELHAYVRTLGQEAREWLLALFVDRDLNLLAVDTVAQGDIGSVGGHIQSILCRGFQLKASGFLLVHNHPSGDPRPSESDIRFTNRIRRISADLDMPLLDHCIVAGDELVTIGGLQRSR